MLWKRLGWTLLYSSFAWMTVGARFVQDRTDVQLYDLCHAWQVSSWGASARASKGTVVELKPVRFCIENWIYIMSACIQMMMSICKRHTSDAICMKPLLISWGVGTSCGIGFETWIKWRIPTGVLSSCEVFVSGYSGIMKCSRISSTRTLLPRFPDTTIPLSAISLCAWLAYAGISYMVYPTSIKPIDNGIPVLDSIHASIDPCSFDVLFSSKSGMSWAVTEMSEAMSLTSVSASLNSSWATSTSSS